MSFAKSIITQLVFLFISIIFKGPRGLYLEGFILGWFVSHQILVLAMVHSVQYLKGCTRNQGPQNGKSIKYFFWVVLFNHRLDEFSFTFKYTLFPSPLFAFLLQLFKMASPTEWEGSPGQSSHTLPFPRFSVVTLFGGFVLPSIHPPMCSCFFSPAP